MENRFTYHNSRGYKREAITDTLSPNTLRVLTSMDIEPIIENVKGERESFIFNHKSPNRHVARVPMFVYEQSVHEGWDEADWKKWLNDPQNDVFRIWRGRV